jgi:hypothetical protein
MPEVRRREFITLIGGAAASPAWPLAARTQQERARLVGIVSGSSENEMRSMLATFREPCVFRVAADWARTVRLLTREGAALGLGWGVRPVICWTMRRT